MLWAEDKELLLSKALCSLHVLARRNPFSQQVLSSLTDCGYSDEDLHLLAASPTRTAPKALRRLHKTLAQNQRKRRTTAQATTTLDGHQEPDDDDAAADDNDPYNVPPTPKRRHASVEENEGDGDDEDDEDEVVSLA